MVQNNIENFTRSLQHMAKEYSDPSVILQHIPVLKDYPVLQQSPEYLFYGVGGIIALLFAKRRFSKWRKSRVKNVALVMPQPYAGAPDHPNISEIAPASFEKREPGLSESDDVEDLRMSHIPQPDSRLPAEPAPRSPTQQLEDVVAISFKARSALTPNEARLRVLVQSVLNEFAAGYTIMARTALSALLEPGVEAVGRERADALAAIEGKYVDFGVFDRTGRCLLALNVPGDQPVIGSKAIERSIVTSALGQAGLPVAQLDMKDTPADIRAKIAHHLKPLGQVQTTAPAQSVQPARAARSANARPLRPVRPVRPAHAAAIAAE